MTNKHKRVDQGGMTYIVESLRVGATKPGQLGTEISGAEVAVLDGVTAGTATASKAVVLGASKEIATLGAVTAGAIVGATLAVPAAGTLTVGTAVITGPAGAATAAGTGANSAGVSTGAVASNVLPIVINGTTFYIPLCSSNA